MNRLFLTAAALLLFLFITGCAPTAGTGIACGPSATVRRQETVRIAESYRNHQWKPSQRNAFRGFDDKGIHVQTPDEGYRPAAPARPGWWVAGRTNIGIPYQWGGFDTPDEFARKVAMGFYAGDVYTDEKRLALDDAVSARACGIDCSGFISRCWRLDRSYSTRELPGLCDELPSFAELRPGDLVNKANDHALLFVRFLDAEKTRFQAYETGSPPTWKVLAHPIEVAYVQGLGYRPYRYHGIRE